MSAVIAAIRSSWEIPLTETSVKLRDGPYRFIRVKQKGRHLNNFRCKTFCRLLIRCETGSVCQGNLGLYRLLFFLDCISR